MTGVGLCLPQLGEGLTPELLQEFCGRAERAGYTSLWVQDHFLWPLEPRRGYGGRAGAPVPAQYKSVLAPTELLAAVAVWTTTPLLGTSVLVAGNHWPAPLAQRLATLDILSGGRLLVGLGVGWNDEEHVASGSDITTRGERMDEFVEVLLACWGDDPVEYEGRFFSLAPSVMRPKPVQRPHPPLLGGMWSAAGLRRTAARFDGWNPAGWPVERAVTALTDMQAQRPASMAPLEVYHRVFAQFPHAPTPPGDVVARLVGEVADAAEAGFREVIIDHNFWSGIASPGDWLDVPELFAPVLAAANRATTHR